MLVDKLRVDFKAGSGGDGEVSFNRIGRSKGKNGSLYYPTKGKPDGGEGGNGGNVFLEGSNNLYDLTSIAKSKIYMAEKGQTGLPLNKQGKAGNDVIIKVPLVSIITNLQGKPILSIQKHGERKLLIRGGKGGLGNHYFKAGQVSTLTKHTKGEIGPLLKCFIELQLSADIIFIGFPNAGKSSLLNILTNANVKVASYPFTTLQPQLGVMRESIKLMDLPGLISGVSEGKGLGTRFNRHTISAKFMAHFISLESEDLEGDYLAIRKELEAFSEELVKKPEVIIVTKSDLYPKEAIEKKTASLYKYNKELLVISSYDPHSIQQVENRFLQLTQELSNKR